MFRKNYFTFLLAVALFAASGIAVFAQSAPVRGKVVMKKADGTIVPVADAVIDVYRTDITGKFPSAKTNKKGEFSFAGFPLGARVAFAISAPGIRADVYPGIKGGDENLNLTVTEGDGKPFTEQEARQIIANASTTAPSGELTAEQKKAQEEYQKQVADVTSKNKNIENINAVVNRSLQEGEKEFKAKNYDAALAKYDEGINADPEFAGTASYLLNNKALVLINRATEKSNATIKDEAAARAEAMKAVKKDYDDAVAAADKSLLLIKNSTETDANVLKNFAATKQRALSSRKEAYRLMIRTGADRTKDKEAAIAFEEYIAAESDPALKLKTQIEFGDMMREAGNSEKSIEAYRAALQSSPDNPDVLAGLGLSLFNAGVVANNTAQKQEGLNLMQKFAEIAPENHALKASVRDAVDYLKTQDKLAPQKVTKKKQ